jgi:hypothetical protein
LVTPCSWVMPLNTPHRCKISPSWRIYSPVFSLSQKPPPTTHYLPTKNGAPPSVENARAVKHGSPLPRPSLIPSNASSIAGSAHSTSMPLEKANGKSAPLVQTGSHSPSMISSPIYLNRWVKNGINQTGQRMPPLRRISSAKPIKNGKNHIPQKCGDMAI